VASLRCTSVSRDNGRAMAQENVEIVRLTFEAVRRLDIDALLKLYDAEIEYLPLSLVRGSKAAAIPATPAYGGTSKRSPRFGKKCAPTPRTYGQSAIT
jgi:hypothetical protein